MKVLCEYPLTWIQKEKKIDGIFLKNLFFALVKNEFEVKLLPTAYTGNGVPIALNQDELLISFHNYNNKCNTLTYKESPIKGLFSIDQSGYSGWADINKNLDNYIDEIKKISITEAEKVIEKYKAKLFLGESKYEQFKQNIALPKDYIFFPLQVRTDSVADLANIDMVAVLKKAAEISEQKQIPLVVKLHPFCNSEVVKATVFMLQNEYKNFYVVNDDVVKLINNSKAVLCCNSGVGFEALILGKQVFCFGESEWYAITKKISSLEDVYSVFNNEISVITNYQKQFICYLLDQYWVDANDAAAIEKKITILIEQYTYAKTLKDAVDINYVNYVEAQKKLEKNKENIKLIERDFKYMNDLLNSFRRKPWLVFSYFFKYRINRFKLDWYKVSKKSKK